MESVPMPRMHTCLSFSAVYCVNGRERAVAYNNVPRLEERKDSQSETAPKYRQWFKSVDNGYLESVLQSESS